MPQPAPDVATVVDEVREDLARRRAAGTLPPLAAGELDRQFSAVVEATDAGVVDEGLLPTADLGGLAVLETWRPPRAGVKGLLTAPFTHLFSRLVGAVVRRQVEAFAARTHDIVAQLAARQHRATRFLVGAHLDRIRTLEARVAELERRLSVTQDPPPQNHAPQNHAAQGHDD